jgi:hypothetical protein
MFKRMILKSIMMQNKNYYYLQTNYPKIYDRTYWGMFSDTAKHEIISNRNRFITDYNIVKKRCKLTKKIYSKHMEIENKDHSECYFNKDYNYVLVTSPYTGKPGLDDYFIENGWTKIYPLYADTANTYIKIVSKND